MEQIPKDVLAEILEYLTLEEREQSRRVSKKWKETIPDLKFYMNESQKSWIEMQFRKIQVFFILLPELTSFTKVSSKSQPKSTTKDLNFTFYDKNKKPILRFFIRNDNQYRIKVFPPIHQDTTEINDINDIIATNQENEDMDIIEKIVENVSTILFYLPTIVSLQIESNGGSQSRNVNLLDRKENEKDQAFAFVIDGETSSPFSDIVGNFRSELFSIFPKYLRNKNQVLEKYMKELLK